MKTILVVEDNPHNLKLAELILQKGGYRVLTATHGEQALQVAHAQHPDLVLMDMQMPGMDGLAATRALRQAPDTAAIKVLALTALAMKGDEERILAAGCNGYLAKPFQYQELLDAVSSMVN
jgi:two-component system cell cycle response regulator DivK